MHGAAAIAVILVDRGINWLTASQVVAHCFGAELGVIVVAVFAGGAVGSCARDGLACVFDCVEIGIRALFPCVKVRLRLGILLPGPSYGGLGYGIRFPNHVACHVSSLLRKALKPALIHLEGFKKIVHCGCGGAALLG